MTPEDSLPPLPKPGLNRWDPSMPGNSRIIGYYPAQMLEYGRQCRQADIERLQRAYRLLFECSHALAMWADVAPAVSLRKDIGDWLRSAPTGIVSQADERKD